MFPASLSWLATRECGNQKVKIKSGQSLVRVEFHTLTGDWCILLKPPPSSFIQKSKSGNSGEHNRKCFFKADQIEHSKLRTLQRLDSGLVYLSFWIGVHKSPTIHGLRNYLHGPNLRGWDNITRSVYAGGLFGKHSPITRTTLAIHPKNFEIKDLTWFRKFFELVQLKSNKHR